MSFHRLEPGFRFSGILNRAINVNTGENVQEARD